MQQHSLSRTSVSRTGTETGHNDWKRDIPHYAIEHQLFTIKGTKYEKPSVHRSPPQIHTSLNWNCRSVKPQIFDVAIITDIMLRLVWGRERKSRKEKNEIKILRNLRVRRCISLEHKLIDYSTFLSVAQPTCSKTASWDTKVLGG